jgi:hypothetical protein
MLEWPACPPPFAAPPCFETQQFWVIVFQLGGEQGLREAGGSQFFGFVSSVAEGTKARRFGCFARVASISS